MAFYDWKPYMSVSARRKRAAAASARFQKTGQAWSPVVVEGRSIARTFWGRAWCDNLERYSDYVNRLPRGRSYVRNGSVLDLKIEPGTVTAIVSGTDLYDVHVAVAEVTRARWSAVCRDCSGAIDSVVELLQGRLTARVMTRLSEEKTGLFPAPREISFSCTCPDRASMCKHVAAVLYGIGARLDTQPELLFALRRVDQQDLVAKLGERVGRGGKRPVASRMLETSDLSEMFGIEISSAPPPAARRHSTRPRRKGTVTHS